MYNSKVFELVKVLSDDEIKGFVDFLNCPLFNANNKIILIAEYFRKHASDLKNKNSKRFQKENVYTAVYPNEAYKDEKFRKQISRFKEMLERYLAITTVYNDSISIEKGLLKFLRKRKVSKYYEDLYEEYYQQQENNKEESISRFYNLYSLLNEYSKSFDIKILGEDYFKVVENRSTYLNQFYCTSILSYQLKAIELCTLLNKNIEKPKKQLKNIIYFIEESSDYFQSSILLFLYYSIAKYILSDAKSLVELEKLVHIIKANSKKIESKEIRGVLFLLAQIKNKQALDETTTEKYFSISKEVFVIYRFLFENNLLLNENNLIHPGLFISIVITSVKIKEIAWAENFVKHFAAYIHPEAKDNIIHYIQGILLNAKGEFNKSLHSLNQISLDSINMYMNTKILTIMNHYELGNIEEFYSVIASFSAYINRNESKFSTIQKKYCNNFVKLSKKLFELKLDSRFSNKTELKEKVSGMEKELGKLGNVGLKIWAEEKLQQI